MPYAARPFTCRCGTVFTRRAPAGSSQECILCRIERSADVATQLHAHQGPAWSALLDRWHQLTGCPLAPPGRNVPLPLPPDSQSPGIPTSTTG